MSRFFNSISGKLIALSVLSCLILLMIHVGDGYYLRPSGDDFAFTDEVVGHNPFGFMHTFLTTMSGRFTNGIVAYPLYHAPDFFVRITPLLFVSLFLVGSYLFFRRWSSINHFLPTSLISIIFTFCLVMIPANQYQTIYWLPSYMSYGLPLALLLILFAQLKHAFDKKLSYISLLYLCLFAFLIAGLHELVAILGAILIAAAWCLFAVNSLLTNKLRGLTREFRNRTIIFLFPFSGFVTGFLVDYLMPATAFRRSVSSIQPEGKLVMIQASWRFSIEMFQDTFREPGIMFCLLSIMLIYLLAYKTKMLSKIKLSLHPLTIYLSIVVLIIMPFLSLFLTAVSARYGYGTPPPERTNFVFYFTLVLCTSILGIVLANLATRLHKQSFMSSIYVTTILLFIFAPLAVYIYSQKTTKLLPIVREQAINFDAREKYIQEQKAAGKRDLLIPSLEIGDTPYPKNDSAVFPNAAIAKYYKVNSIKAYGYPTY